MLMVMLGIDPYGSCMKTLLWESIAPVGFMRGPTSSLKSKGEFLALFSLLNGNGIILKVMQNH